MPEPVRVLHLEDTANDAELVRAALDESGVEFEILNVSTRDGFVAGLESGRVDLILSDYALPGFDGLTALAIAGRMAPDVPFILVSGTMGEEAAIESLRNGATDYVLKHRLSRLAPAVRRTLEEAAERATRRAAEETLEHERKFLRALLDSLEVGVVACDQTGTLTFSNRATRELHGLPEEPVPPEQWDSHYQLYSADGVTQLKAEEIPLYRVLKGETLRNVEMGIRHRSGRARTVLTSGQPIIDDLGKQLGAVVVLHDVTEHKELEKQFRQAQKMEAMGMLAAGVAHDFNNFLTVITGYCQLLHSRMQPGDPALQDVEEIANAGKRATDLTRHLLAFSRRQVLEPRVLDLNTTITEMGKMLRRLIGADIDLVFAPARNVGCVRADAGQIEQVLMNLVVNARDAMPGGGRITVETASLVVGEPRSGATRDAASAGATDSVSPGAYRMTPEMPPGRYASFTVSDSGSGMDNDTASQVFLPFFTTKETGKGTGLGLSTVDGIVSQSGGYLALRTELGRGTSFTIYLPRVAGEDSTTPVPSEVSVNHGAEAILVVDDEEAIRGLVSQILRLGGYSAVVAANGEAAIALLEQDPLAIDAVITDMIMPKLGGRELADRLRAVRPDLPMLFMSGYPGKNIDPIDSSWSSGIGYVQKPFTPDALLRKLREVLDGPVARAA